MKRFALGLAVVLIASCGKIVDKDKLESIVTKGCTDAKIGVKKLTCPSGRKAKAGDKFTCQGSTTDGQDFTVDITQTDDDGTVKWEVRGSVFEASALAGELAKGKLSDPKCAHPVMIVEVGKTITCDVVADGAPAKVDITILSDAGDFSWKLVK